MIKCAGLLMVLYGAAHTLLALTVEGAARPTGIGRVASRSRTRQMPGSEEEPTTMTDPKPAAEPAARRTYRITVDVEATLASGPGEGSAGPSWAEAARHHGDLVGRLLDRPELLEGLLRSSAIDALGRARERLRTERGWGRTPEQGILKEAMEGMTEGARAYFEEELEDGASAYLFDGYGADVVRVAISEIRPEPSS